MPIVGYVDGIYAKDLVSMLLHVCDVELQGSISNGAVLCRQMYWSDRSAAALEKTRWSSDTKRPLCSST
jgi:hypothetical protein